MNTLLLIKVLSVIFIFIIIPILMLIFIIVWMNRNKYYISIYKKEEGAYINKGGRYRVINDRFYSIRTFKFLRWGKPSFKGLLYSNVKEDIIISEGMPVIGIKRTLKLKKYQNEYISWKPPYNLSNVGYIKDTIFMKLSVLRQELYEATKTELSKNEMLMKVAVPMGLIMLAIACLIFFPKIYSQITSQSVSGFSSAKAQVFDWLGQKAPLG